MPKSGSNARPYNRNQKILMGEKIPGTRSMTRGKVAQAEREGRAKASTDILSAERKAKARAKENAPSRARVAPILNEHRPGTGRRIK